MKEKKYPPNIILTGFMGTGKTTTGQILAQQLKREFIDMDAVIEARTGQTINQIFAEYGEAYFRNLEADLCQELATRKGLVIATGGGTLVSEENLRVIEKSGPVICLDCEPDILWQRIGRSKNRPMLAEQDEERFHRLATLLEQRQEAYQRISHHLDATYMNPIEAATALYHYLKKREMI